MKNCSVKDNINSVILAKSLLQSCKDNSETEQLCTRDTAVEKPSTQYWKQTKLFIYNARKKPIILRYIDKTRGKQTQTY